MSTNPLLDDLLENVGADLIIADRTALQVAYGMKGTSKRISVLTSDLDSLIRVCNKIGLPAPNNTHNKNIYCVEYESQDGMLLSCDLVEKSELVRHGVYLKDGLFYQTLNTILTNHVILYQYYRDDSFLDTIRWIVYWRRANIDPELIKVLRRLAHAENLEEIEVILS